MGVASAGPNRLLANEQTEILRGERQSISGGGTSRDMPFPGKDACLSVFMTWGLVWWRAELGRSALQPCPTWVCMCLHHGSGSWRLTYWKELVTQDGEIAQWVRHLLPKLANALDHHAPHGGSREPAPP